MGLVLLLLLPFCMCCCASARGCGSNLAKMVAMLSIKSGELELLYQLQTASSSTMLVDQHTAHPLNQSTTTTTCHTQGFVTALNECPPVQTCANVPESRSKYHGGTRHLAARSVFC
jgi:hypothetical protein